MDKMESKGWDARTAFQELAASDIKNEVAERFISEFGYKLVIPEQADTEDNNDVQGSNFLERSKKVLVIREGKDLFAVVVKQRGRLHVNYYTGGGIVLEHKNDVSPSAIIKAVVDGHAPKA